MTHAGSAPSAPEWKVWTALGIVYVVWGSTYMAIRVVVESMPPLLTAGVRFALAGLILFTLLALTRRASSMRLSRAEWLGAGFVGLALLLGGNGLVVLGERDVPSALAALIVAVIPLWVVILRRVFGERIALGTIVGVVAGFAGVAVLIVPRGLAAGGSELIGMLMLVVAGLSWSVGSYFSKRVALPRDPLASTAAQMIAGGAGLLVVGVLVGEVGLANFSRFSERSLIAFVYLLLLGSVLAYTAYTWLLQNAPVSRVATYAYVNPVVAIVLGWWLLHEEINATMLAGAAMIIVSVAVVMRTERRAARTGLAAGAAEASPAAVEEITEVEQHELERPDDDFSRLA